MKSPKLKPLSSLLPYRLKNHKGINPANLSSFKNPKLKRSRVTAMALSSLRLRRTLHRYLAGSPPVILPRSYSSSSPTISRGSLASVQSFSSPSLQQWWSHLLQSRSFKSSPVSNWSSRSMINNQNDEIGPDTILFEGCDYNHWLIVMDFPKDNKPPPEEMIRTYEETCAKGLGISVEEAKKKMYACSTTTYTGFQAVMTEEESEKFNGLPGVIFVLPDSYIDPQNKEYGGDKYIDGTIIPRPPPVQYGRQAGRFRDRNRYPDQPRYERQGAPMPNQQGNPSYGQQQGSMPGGGMNYGPPQKSASPQQNYSPPAQNYASPQQNYGAPRQNYASSQPQNYNPPGQNYASPQQQNYGQNYASSQPQNYGPPGQNYASPPPQNYGSPGQNYASTQPQNYSPPGQNNASPQPLNYSPPGQNNASTQLPKYGSLGQNYASPQPSNYGSPGQNYASRQQPNYGSPGQNYTSRQQLNYGSPGQNYPLHEQQNYGSPGQGERRDSMPTNSGGGRDSYQSGSEGPMPPYQGNYKQGEQGNFPEGDQRNDVPKFAGRF